MVELLPIHVQKCIIDKLRADDYVGAKEIYDQWHRRLKQSPWDVSKNTDVQDKQRFIPNCIQ